MNRAIELVAVAAVLFSHESLAEPASTITETQPQSESQNAPLASRSVKPSDDWELANQLLRAAKAGDRDSQYRMFVVIDDCEMLMGYYFTREGTPLTLDEGLQRAANASQKQQALEGFLHCHRFPEHSVALELGSADYWLEKATQSGQPLAQAVTARRKLDRDAQDTAVPLGGNRSSGISISIPSGAAPDRRAVDLLRAAVKSLNPQVLEIIGSEQTELHGSRKAETVDRYAWIYVACQRGLNCSATSHLAKDCPNSCDTSTPESILMAWSREEWPAVQLRAKEISAKLDAGKWGELGLGRD